MIKCINCGKEAEHWHHVIPKSLGGNDGTNLVPLCSECHSLIHNYSFSNGIISHSALIKHGLEKARLEGKQIGGKKGNHYNIKKRVNAEIIIKQYSKDFYGTLYDNDVIALAGISRKTYYKYKKELKENEKSQI